MYINLYAILFIACLIPAYSLESNNVQTAWPDIDSLGTFFPNAVSKMAAELSSPVPDEIPPYFGINKDDIPYCRADFFSSFKFSAADYEGLEKIQAVARLISNVPDDKRQQTTDLFDGDHSFLEVLFTLTEESLKNHHKVGQSQKNVVLDVISKLLSGHFGKKAKSLDFSLQNMLIHYRKILCNLTHEIAMSTNSRVAYTLSGVLSAALKQAESFRYLVKDLLHDLEKTVTKVVEAGQMILGPGRKDVNFLMQRGIHLVGELVGRTKTKVFAFVSVATKELSGVPKFAKVYVVEMLKIAVSKIMNQFLRPMPINNGSKFP